jgi:transposase
MIFDKYIGLDLHIGSSYFVVESRNGEICERAKVETTEGELIRYVRSVKGRKALALEETSLSQWAYLLLSEEVDRIIVCNAAQKGRRQGPKTDFRDACELAELMRINGLEEVFHTGNPRMELRVLVNSYVDLMQEIVRGKNRYKALFGREAKSEAGASFYRNKEKIKLLASAEKKFAAKHLLDQINLLEEQKEAYKDRFSRNIRRFKEMKLLISIPGIGPVFANQLVGLLTNA